MVAPWKRVTTLLALIALSSLVLTTGPASAAGKPDPKGKQKCAKKQGKKPGKKKARKCRKKPGGGLGSPDNPQVGDLIQALESNVTIGTSPTTVVSIPSSGPVNTSWEFRGAITVANADQARGRSVNCNLTSGAGSAGRAATTIQPATVALPIQYQMMQAYATGTGGPAMSLVCTATPAPVIVVEARVSALRLNSITTISG